MTVTVLLAFLSVIQTGGTDGFPGNVERSKSWEVEQAPPFSATSSVVSSTSSRTVVDISIHPTDPSRLPCSQQIGLGLVAVAHTGRIKGSVVAVEASLMSDPTRHTTYPPSSLPEQFLLVSEPGIWRELRVVRVAVAPSWTDSEGVWLARRVVVSIENAGGEGIAEKQMAVRPVSPMWDRLYRAHVLNYESQNLSRLQRGTSPRYIIISRDRFNSFTTQFVEWKTRQGYGVELCTLEDLGYWDPMDGEAIEATKRYINQAYVTWPEPPEFILLVGDMYEGIPAGSIYSKKFIDFIWGGSGDAYYDTWYSLLDGPDILPDVMVGRFPDTNVRRLEYMLEKSIDYEKNPNREGQWQLNAVMTVTHPNLDHPTVQTKRDLDSDFDGWGMNSTLLINEAANPASIVPLINQGLSFYNFRGWGCDLVNWDYTFRIGDVAYVSNPRKLAIYTVMSCHTALITSSMTSTAEALLRHGYQNPSNPIGAVAFIGSQGGTWYLHNNALDTGIYRAITNEGATILGEALLSGKTYAFTNTAPSDTQDVLMKEYTILGDPSLQFWTRVPQPMVVSANPSEAPLGQVTDVTVTVSDSGTADPVSDALVCLWRRDDVYEYGYTDDGGSLILSVSPESSTTSDIDLTVTAYNRIPVLDSIGVTAGWRPESPEHITLTEASGGGIEITWASVTRSLAGSSVVVERYEVYRASITDSAQGNESLVGITKEPRYMDNSISVRDGTHFYRVVAITVSGYRSKPSEPVGVSTRRLER